MPITNHYYEWVWKKRGAHYLVHPCWPTCKGSTRLKKNQNAPRPSEHPPVRGKKNVKTFRWDLRLQINTNPFYWNYLEDYWPWAGGLSAVNATDGYASAWPDKLGTSPDGVWRYKWLDAATEIGKNPVSKYPIQPGYGKWAGWRGTGQPNPSRETKFSGASGDREILIFPVQQTTSRIGNLTRSIRTLVHVMTMPT